VNTADANSRASDWQRIKKERLLKIRKSSALDGTEIEKIHIKAFGKEKGSAIADLVNGLFNDKTATPLLSLVAVEGDQLIGHILLTKATFTQTTEPVSARILAPLAVLPGIQRKGVGGRLIEEGLIRLKETGVELVFVLGHPDYYPRYGFIPAGDIGYEAPYPIPEEHAGAWMVQELSAGVIGRINGKVRCSDALNQPEHWRE
jgi:predicted N-acetyltransferase YhbS